MNNDKPKGAAMSNLAYYTTKHREHETSVYNNADVAILTIGAAGCEANIHLNAADCRAVAAMLLNAAASIDPVPVAEAA